MHKLMCTFMTPMKKKIPDRNLDTSCPAGIPRNKQTFNSNNDISKHSLDSTALYIHDVYSSVAVSCKALITTYRDTGNCIVPIIPFGKSLVR